MSKELLAKIESYYGANPEMRNWVQVQRPRIVRILRRSQAGWGAVSNLIGSVMADQPAMFRNMILDSIRQVDIAQDLMRDGGVLPTTTTPGTRITWGSLREWLDGLKEIEDRRHSSLRYEQERAHWAALPMRLIETAPISDLAEFGPILEKQKPPRGQREDHFTTRLAEALDRGQIRAMGRVPGSMRREQVEALIKKSRKYDFSQIPEYNILSGIPVENIPMINDETLWGEVKKLEEAAPRLGDQIGWVVGECVRRYSECIFVEIAKVAHNVSVFLNDPKLDDEKKLRWLARAQDCLHLAAKTYSRGASYFYSGVSATGYDAIRVVAKEGAEWALKTYASRIGFEADSEWDKFANSGLLARAVLGNQKATRILDALKAGAFTISSKGQNDGMGGRHVALVLSPDESDAFNPPILVGYVAPNLVEKQGTPVALIRGNMYAILHQYADSGLETDGDAPYLDKIKTGAFTIENEIRDAGLGVSPAMILKSGGVNNYYQNMIRRLLVPLGLITIRQATIDDYSNTHDLRQLVDDLVWKFKYERVYGSKKDAEGYSRVIVFKKSSAKNTNHYPEDIVWISPDPFAKTGKKGAK